MRFRKVHWGGWWWLGELCEVPRCRLWRGLRHHCPTYNVSCIFFNKCLYFSYYMDGYFLDRSWVFVCVCIPSSLCQIDKFKKIKINKKEEEKPCLGGSVCWCVVPYTKRLQVWSLIRVHTGSNLLMFLSNTDVSLSLSLSLFLLFYL